MKPKAKDNSTLIQKVQLRRNLLKEIESPVVMETNGGYGIIWSYCYAELPSGIVFEKNEAKTGVLARQRPTWAVYECDCVEAIKAGAGKQLPVNFLDIDPYGEPWPIIDAFFESDRPFPGCLGVVVNDGLRQNLKMNGGWNTGSMAGVVSKYGNNALYKNYLDICRELVQEKAGQVGYTLTRWGGYYCGHADQMTHYAAILEKR